LIRDFSGWYGRCDEAKQKSIWGSSGQIRHSSCNNYLPRGQPDQCPRNFNLWRRISGRSECSITLNKGKRDGLQSGHVLALNSKGRVIKNEGADLALPDERYGLLFVFRVFEKVSYALVMQTRLPVQLLDRAVTP
jgi:hypothetical protein